MKKDKISHLTYEQKLRLYDLTQEKRRRLKQRKALFKPLPEQLEIMRDTSYERIVTCGNGFGKTTVAVHEAIWKCQGYNPITEEFSKVPATVYVGLDKPDKIDQRWKIELDKWFEIDWATQGVKHGKPYYQEIIFPNGSNIIFMFHDQDPMAFESIEADAVIFDEPPPRHMYFGLTRGLRKKGTKPFILLVGTPLQGSWIRRELFIPWEKGEISDINFFKFASDANKQNWPKDYEKRFFGRLSDKEQRVRRHGEFFDIDGLALAHLYQPELHLVNADRLDWEIEANPCVLIIDPHPSKKHYAVLLGAHQDGNIYYLMEHAEKCTASDFAESLIAKGWFDFNIIDVVWDSLGSAENTSGEGFHPFGERFNKVLRHHGYGQGRATSYKEKNDEEFIDRIQSVLAPMKGEAGLRIVSHCFGIIRDIEGVSWVKQKNLDENKPKLDIQNKDFLACLKYGLATNLYYEKAKKKKIYRMNKLPGGYVGDRSIRDKKAAKIKTGLRNAFFTRR